MDGIKYAVFTDKSIRLLGKNQYTSNVESGSTRTEIKHWVELFFGVKVIAMNSHRLPGKGRRMGPIMGHRTYYGTYNALQTYDHYASTGLFYSTSYKEKNLNQNT
uniref:Large ribosomal subunit protein uL23c n=17 Tax=Trigonotis TaxID=203765 RepID=A0A9E9JSM9_9BORA|nr:ribosomal protein L23 [Trigonotis barkamensis]YP_010611237.1 ribosomal protein L23 [Trigonotis barkamensis]YP_010611472.1 ribosomal protein L23 [Trigonotis cinereifolia]YP_010611492.1 ribosomal protein L23 [Trigonotis cinereifolia]YP_010611558.1 ribosomal protein L23 [Trigonotis coreana]YP_010611578.1 ribosomal protein L23 [Trigonotis coreana]YP_010611642.1 ribosomal protein L23 [Trigonotis corispermoides]YP_010611662.1 ribosomal protein L23 [Trigonotis corispermoides]YP_010611727.1 ribo